MHSIAQFAIHETRDKHYKMSLEQFLIMLNIISADCRRSMPASVIRVKWRPARSVFESPFPKMNRNPRELHPEFLNSSR